MSAPTPSVSGSTFTTKVELIARRLGVDMTLQGVGKYLARWGLKPQKPAHHSREQDPDEVGEFMEQTLPQAQEQAEEEGAKLHLLHFLDEVRAQVQDQIGTSYAPVGETPVQAIAKHTSNKT